MKLNKKTGICILMILIVLASAYAAEEDKSADSNKEVVKEERNVLAERLKDAYELKIKILGSAQRFSNDPNLYIAIENYKNLINPKAKTSIEAGDKFFAAGGTLGQGKYYTPALEQYNKALIEYNKALKEASDKSDANGIKEATGKINEVNTRINEIKGILKKEEEAKKQKIPEPEKGIIGKSLDSAKNHYIISGSSILLLIAVIILILNRNKLSTKFEEWNKKRKEGKKKEKGKEEGITKEKVLEFIDYIQQLKEEILVKIGEKIRDLEKMSLPKKLEKLYNDFKSNNRPLLMDKESKEYYGNIEEIRDCMFELSKIKKEIVKELEPLYKNEEKLIPVLNKLKEISNLNDSEFDASVRPAIGRSQTIINLISGFDSNTKITIEEHINPIIELLSPEHLGERKDDEWGIKVFKKVGELEKDDNTLKIIKEIDNTILNENEFLDSIKEILQRKEESEEKKNEGEGKEAGKSAILKKELDLRTIRASPSKGGVAKGGKIKFIFNWDKKFGNNATENPEIFPITIKASILKDNKIVSKENGVEYPFDDVKKHSGSWFGFDNTEELNAGEYDLIVEAWTKKDFSEGKDATDQTKPVPIRIKEKNEAKTPFTEENLISWWNEHGNEEFNDCENSLKETFGGDIEIYGGLFFKLAGKEDWYTIKVRENANAEFFYLLVRKNKKYDANSLNKFFDSTLGENEDIRFLIKPAKLKDINDKSPIEKGAIS